MKKLIAILLIPFFACWPVASYAIWPLLAPLAGSGAMATLTSSPVAISALVHGSILAAVVLSPTLSSPSPSSADSITVLIDNKVEIPNRPLDYTAPQAGSQQPTPPATKTPTGNATGWSRYEGDPLIRSTPAELCTYTSGSNGELTQTANTYNGFPTYQCFDPDSGITQDIIAVQVSNSCPSGYTLSGSSCNLSNAAATVKPADGKCTILRTGNLFSGDPQDPDCNNPLPDNIVISGDAKQLTAYKPDGTYTRMEMGADGGVIIYDVKSNADNTTTTTTVQTSSPDANGQSKVIGTKTESVVGTGTLATPVGGGAGSSVDVSGLNKETTQSAISAKLSSIDTTLKGDGTEGNAADVKSAEAASGLDQLLARFTGFDSNASNHGLPSPSLPQIASCGCSPLTMSFNGHNASFDWCPYIDTFRDALGYVIYIGTAYYLFDIARGKK